MNVETGPEPIVLSPNAETSINELYSTIGGLLNYFPRAKYKPQKANDVKHMWFSNSRAKKLLGWEPKMSLKEGLVKDVVPYYQKQLEVQNEVATGHDTNANL
jgi:nucleoside-diphosphate-sugar epimerase